MKIPPAFLFLIMSFAASSDFAPFLGPLPVSMNMRTFTPPQIMVTNNIPKLTSSSETATVDFLSQQLKINESELKLKSASKVGTANVYTFEHVKDGLPIINHEVKITVMDTEILTYSHNFEGELRVASCPTKKSESEMKEHATSRFKSTIVPGTTQTVLVDVGSGQLVEALKMQLAIDGNPGYEIAVDYCNLDIVYFVDYTA
jgi:hypothetical protein